MSGNYIWHCDNNGTKRIGFYDHNRHPVSWPHRRAMGCLLWGFWRKLMWYWHHTVLNSCLKVFRRWIWCLSLAYLTTLAWNKWKITLWEHEQFIMTVSTVRQQAIPSAYVSPDLYLHIASLGHSELMACHLFSRQTLNSTNADLLSVRLHGTKLSEIWIDMRQFIHQKYLIILSLKYQPFCFAPECVKHVTGSPSHPYTVAIMSSVQWICLPSDRSPVDYRAVWYGLPILLEVIK